MKRFPLLLVAALLGAAVSVPAQFQNNGRSGRESRGAVVVPQQSPRGQASQRATRPSRNIQNPRTALPVASRSAHVSDNRQVGRVGHVRTVSVVVRPVPVLVGFDSGRRHSHGHWQTRCEQVLVPGYWDIQYHAAVFGWVLDSCGHRSWGVLEPAHDHRIWVPACYETQTRQVWVCY